MMISKKQMDAIEQEYKDRQAALLAELNRQTNDLEENLAEYAHEAWSGWMNYLLSKAQVNADGTWTIPAQSAERWYRQMTTPYFLLPEFEKVSDRAEAQKMIDIMNGPPEAAQDLTVAERL